MTVGPTSKGKVRDIYDLGRELVLVATDRISAYDVILPNAIPHKGQVLTLLSAFWFEKTLEITRNHMISIEPETVLEAMRDAGAAISFPDEPEVCEQPARTAEDFRLDEARAAIAADRSQAWLQGRSMLCRKADVIPVECVVRGYLAGSGWAEYQRSGTVCGVELPAGLRESDKLPGPIFTPTTKAESGHDQAIDFEGVARAVGPKLAVQLRDCSLALYSFAHGYALERGIIIADTKFEFGTVGDTLTLIDELLTPDSSRFWPADQYEPGHGQPSFDKQFVRDWLDASGWDHEPPPPALPEEVVAKTSGKYIEAYERLTGQKFPHAGA